MRKIIREKMFDSHRPQEGGCELCNAREGTQDAHVERVKELFKPPHPNLKRQFSSDYLVCCKKCGAYFALEVDFSGAEKNWDEISGIKKITPIFPLEGHLIIWEGDDVIERLLNKEPRKWQGIYNHHVEGRDQARKKFMEKAHEGILLGASILNQRFAQNLEEATEWERAEGEVASLLQGYLMGYLKKLSVEEIIALLPLINDSRERIAHNIASGINIGLFDYPGTESDFEKIKQAVEKLPQNMKLKDILNTLKDKIGPYEAWEDFFTFSFSTSKGVMEDEALKRHLETLEGLVVTSFIEEVYTEAIIDFEYAGYRFHADNAYMSWSFSVKGKCPEEILARIISHCQSISN